MIEFPALPYPWQQYDWQQLCQQIAANKLPHALMLAGPSGIGKRHLAHALAHLVLCQSPIEGTPCRKCRSCQLNHAQTHPDFIYLVPEEGSKSIKVDQIRVLSESLTKTAQQGGYKVVVLEPAEAMNTNAANALLKSLEEPGAGTLLILVSHTPSAVLPTIRSRCQMRAMPMPRREQVLHWLTPLMAKTANNAEELLNSARGAPLIALGLLEGDRLEWLEQLQQNWERLTLGQLSPIDLGEQWHRDDVLGIIEWLLGWLHGLACWRVGSSEIYLNEFSEAMRDQMTHVPVALLHRYIEKMLASKRQLLSNANPNKQLLLEELLLDWGVLVRVSTNPKLAAGQV